MDAINRETRTSVNFHLGYVIAMPWVQDRGKGVNFQKALLDAGLEFSQVSSHPNNIRLIRNEPSHLQIKLDAPAPQLTSMQITSTNPQHDLDMFIHECNAAMAAFQQVSNTPQYQIIRTTAKIQHVYSLSMHAFKYLWEKRLGQSSKDFHSLGDRPVAGGGLRLIMPPHAKENEEPKSIEVRFESSLRDAKQILIETIFFWPQPRVLQNDQKFDPKSRLAPLEDYAANEVWGFLTQAKGENEPE